MVPALWLCGARSLFASHCLKLFKKGGSIFLATAVDTKETVLELTRAYIGRKQRNSENFTQEEMRGEFFFPPNSDEFKQIMVNTVLGKEKLFFLGNYFPHRRCAGVKCEVNFRDEEVESMTYPREQGLASG